MPKSAIRQTRHNSSFLLYRPFSTNTPSKGLCSNITNETLSATTANTSEGARLDIAMNGFWGGRFEKTFVDVRVFNPTVTQQSPHATKNMKTRRKGHTIKELERWSMQRLHPSFFQLRVVYRGRQLFSTNVLQVSCPPRPTNHTAKP